MRCLVNQPFVIDRLYERNEVIEINEHDAAGANAVQPGLLTPINDDGTPIAGRPSEGGKHLPVLRVPVTVSVKEDVFVRTDAFMPPFRGEERLLDLPMMCDLAYALKPNHIVEFGTAYGNSAVNLAKHAPDALIYTVNALPEQIKGRNITQAFTKDEIGRLFLGTAFEERICQIYADTKTLTKKELGIKSAEMVIIDGCHDYDYVISDFALALRLLPSTNSIILVHDALPTGPFPEIYDALVHLRTKGHDIRLIENTSWAICAGDFMSSPWDEIFEEVEA